MPDNVVLLRNFYQADWKYIEMFKDGFMSWRYLKKKRKTLPTSEKNLDYNKTEWINKLQGIWEKNKQISQALWTTLNTCGYPKKKKSKALWSKYGLDLTHKIVLTQYLGILSSQNQARDYQLTQRKIAECWG